MTTTPEPLPEWRHAVFDALELPDGERVAFVRRRCADEGLDTDAALAFLADVAADTTSLGGRADEPRGFEPGRVVGRRYAIRAAIGAGAHGRVHRALDEFTGRPVAVKELFARGDGGIARARGELAALRLLWVPGVVRWLDDGVDDGVPFVVMEFVDGAPFPGARPSRSPWNELARAATSLLEALARVHAQRVVHRDLKPANVLVDVHDVATILDLGISGGPAVPRPGRDVIAGTPAYISPEHLRGDPATSASDVYAVGVMLFEALEGRNPHRFDDVEELRRVRCGREPSLRWASDATPPEVRALVRDMLSLDSSARPTAAHAAAVLKGQLPPDAFLDGLPGLGHVDAVDAIVARVVGGRDVGVYGPPRAGTTRCLARVAVRLRERGRRVAWIDAATARIDDTCDVLVVDELADDVDVPPDVTRGRPVVRSLRDPRRADVALAPVDDTILERLFAGPDRLFHLREDAVSALRARTGGWPGRVAEEVAAWVRAGLACVEDERLVVTRAGLDGLGDVAQMSAFGSFDARGVDEHVVAALETGGLATPGDVARATGLDVDDASRELDHLVHAGATEVDASGAHRLLRAPRGAAGKRPGDALLHETLARTLPEDAPERVRHMVASGDHEAAVAAALARGLTALHDGRVGIARVALGQGLVAARSVGGRERALVAALVRLAFAEGTERAFELALYELARCEEEKPVVDDLERLARAGLAALRGDGDGSLALLEACAPFDDDDLSDLAQATRAMAARTGDREREDEVLAAVRDHAERHARPRVQRQLLEAEGWRAYVHSDFERAAALHERALALADDARSRISVQLNIADALLEVGRFEDVERASSQALAEAAAARHAHYEARAESQLRAAAYRSGRATTVDGELVKAVERLSVPSIEGQIKLTEAAVAWRAGEHGRAARLASEARAAWRRLGHPWGERISRALEIAAGSDVSGHDVEALCTAVDEACPVPSLGAQVLALVGRVDPERGETSRPLRERLIHSVPGRREMRREVLTMEECL